MPEVRLLGPVELADDAGAPVPLGTPKQRAVFTLLAVRAGRQVTVDDLVDELWGAHPPRSAVANVRTYAAGLRRAIEAHRLDGLRLQPRGGGYVLHLSPADLDVEVFRGAVRDGRQAQERGEPDAAVAHLERALILWRGEPIEDVPVGDILATHRAALRDERANALEACLGARLDTGGAAAVVAPLREHLHAWPTRERAWELLVLALATTGDVAGALSAYGRARSALVDELGIEPGPRLRELQQELLSGTLRGPNGPNGRAVVPAQLPRPLPRFAGRRAQLRQLDGLLTGGGQHGDPPPVAVVSGTAGVGKTTLALHWAHQVKDRFPDGQLYVDLRGFGPSGTAVDPGDALLWFLDAFEVPPGRIPNDLAARASLYRSRLAGRRVLVVLDNARDAAQVRPLLPGTAECLAVITSRDRLIGLGTAYGAQPVPLGLLTPEEARGLIVERLDRRRVDDDAAAVERIVSRCAGLPLALAVVTARAAAQPDLPLTLLADELTRDRGVLDAFAVGDEDTDARAVFSWSYRLLPDPVARLFRLLAVHPGRDITAAAAADLTEVPVAGATALLAELVRASLVVESVPGRYAMHDLLRSYAAEQCAAVETEQERRAALGRLLDHYLRVAAAADGLLYPHREPLVPPPSGGNAAAYLSDHADALAWLTAERRNLLAAIRRSAEAGFDCHTWRLAWTLADHLDRRGRWHDLIVTQEFALAAARRRADCREEAYAHRHLGVAHSRLDRHGEALDHFHRALKLFDRVGHRLGAARTHLDLATAAERTHDPAAALRHAERALDFFRAAEDVSGQANGLNGVGWYHALLGRHDVALRHCREAIRLHQAIGDRRGEASTWDSLGYAHHHLGQDDEALDCYQRAVRIFRDLGDRYNEAVTVLRIGDHHSAAGDRPAAAGAWTEALAVLTELGHPDAHLARGRLATIGRLPAGAT